MSEIKLTLEPEAEVSATAVAVAEAPKAEAVSVEEQKPETVNNLKNEGEVLAQSKLDLSSLSEEEQAAVKEFSKKIDVSDAQQVMNYGSAAQKNISEFSEAALSSVRTKDMGEVGDMLSSLVVQLKGLDFDEEEQNFFKRIFKKSTNRLAALKADYEKAEVNVNAITNQLEQHEIALMKDISLMDKMYEKNEEYLKELTMYIIAGKLKIKELREVALPELQKKAKESGLAEDAQEASDFANLIGRFEKKIHDLELTRTISLQMAPQIRMIQNTDSLMAEKIRTSINNTIPLWKNQMVLAITLYHSESAMKAQNEVDEVTNDLLKNNAEKLHHTSTHIAEASERGIVDLETLQHTNAELISTLTEVKQIQDSGRARRAAAEVELAKIESELKDKLLSING